MGESGIDIEEQHLTTQVTFSAFKGAMVLIEVIGAGDCKCIYASIRQF